MISVRPLKRNPNALVVEVAPVHAFNGKAFANMSHPELLSAAIQLATQLERARVRDLISGIGEANSPPEQAEEVGAAASSGD